MTEDAIESRALAILTRMIRTQTPLVVAHIGPSFPAFRTNDPHLARLTNGEIVGYYDSRCELGWLKEDLAWSAHRALP